MEYVLKPLSENLIVSKIANLHFFKFEKSFSTKDDKHPFHELIYVKKGSLHVSSSDYTGLLKRGELIIHRSNEVHSLTCPTDTSPIVIIIGFVCNTKDLDYFSRAPVKLNEGDKYKLAEIIKEGRNIFAPPYDIPTYNMRKKENIPFGGEQILKILIESFLINIVREFHFDSQHPDIKPLSPPTIKEVIAYLDSTFTQKISIDELVFLFNSNRSKLCREFKAVTGLTILEYINRKKIALAKELLSTTDKSITDIAAEMNFETIHYFTTFFKQQTGLSPKEYRATLPTTKTE